MRVVAYNCHDKLQVERKQDSQFVRANLRIVHTQRPSLARRPSSQDDSGDEACIPSTPGRAAFAAMVVHRRQDESVLPLAAQKNPEVRRRNRFAWGKFVVVVVGFMQGEANRTIQEQ